MKSKNMIYRIGILYLILIFTLGRAVGQTSIDTMQVIKNISAVLDAQCKAWNGGDIDGYMNGYWRSDSLVFTSGGNIERGWKKTLEKYKKSYDSRSKMGILFFSDLRFSVLSENSAWALGHWQLKRESDSPEGVFTLIFKKFDNGWKIVHDHTSSKK
jgi:ketosteroid isomerase-like protein